MVAAPVLAVIVCVVVVMAIPYPSLSGYTNTQGSWYVVDIPTGWVLQPPNMLDDVLVGSYLRAVFGGMVGDEVSHTYAEPESLRNDAVPKQLVVSAAPTRLSLEEYVWYEGSAANALAELYGADVRYLGSSYSMLGEYQAAKSEYRIVIPDHSFTIKSVTAIVDGVAYSVGYMAEDGAYRGGLHHLERAAESFRPVPAGAPTW